MVRPQCRPLAIGPYLCSLIVESQCKPTTINQGI
jgi:hypothetical protein